MVPARQSICIVIVTGKFVATYVHWGSILMDIFCRQAGPKAKYFSRRGMRNILPHLHQPRMTEQSTMATTPKYHDRETEII